LAVLRHCKNYFNAKEQECFRSYALMGEILPVLVVFKIKEEKQCQFLTENSRLFEDFGQNLCFQPFFRKKDTSQMI